MPSDITIGDDILDVTPQENAPTIAPGTPEAVSEHLLLLVDTYVALVSTPTPDQVRALAFALGMPDEELTSMIDSMLVAGDEFGDIQSVVPQDDEVEILSTDLTPDFTHEEPQEFFVEADVQTDLGQDFADEDEELVEELEVDGEPDGEDELDEFTQDGTPDPARKEPTATDDAA